MKQLSRLQRWGALTVVCAVTLSCGLTELLYPKPLTTPTATPQPPSATPSAEANPSSDTPTVTHTPTPSATPTPQPPLPTTTHTPSPESTTAMTTDTPPSPPTGTATPTPTPTLPGLRIESFDVQMADAPGGGKVIECSWNTTGATSVRIVVGVRQRFPVWEDGPADGSTSFEVTETLYANPEVTLTAFGTEGGEAIQSYLLDWPCTHVYFFALEGVAVPDMCPSGTWVTVQGAEQPFQGGAMLWLPGIDGFDWVYALHNDGTWQRHLDTWEEGLPVDDPSIVAPSGLVQPVRGFGKVWRENPNVRDKMDWGTAPESSVVIRYQRQAAESLHGVQFIQAAGSGLLRLQGLGGSGSTWTPYP